MAFCNNRLQEGQNINPQKILKAFLDSEKCLMHPHTAEIQTVEINLSNEELDDLILRGQQRLHAASKG